MAASLSLVAGGGDAARSPGASHRWRAGPAAPLLPERGEPVVLPGAGAATLAEIFAASPRDGGWTGFLLPQLAPGKPWLWVQERMAILEAGRVHPPGLSDRLEAGRLHPPGLGAAELIHVAARDAREALWAMEEGLRCAAIGAVIGEIYGDPQALDFTATRRLAVAAERHGVAALLIRLGGHANLSGARFRWRVASAPSLAHPFNPKASGAPAWEAELFRARGGVPGRWSLAHEGGDSAPFHLVAGAGDRALDQDRQAAAG